MNKISLILTSDYEVWGNGSGCVENCIIEPADRMLQIAGKYKAPITFFLDVCEFWAFQEIENKGLFNNKYSPATIIREQLRNAVKQGNDVQLHFHPQWLNFKFISNQNWQLDSRYWRLSEIDNFHNSEWSLESLFDRGIATLHSLFGDLDSNYKVSTFRAGAWCIQPSERIIDVLGKKGIVSDSTVAPGIKKNENLTKFDFSSHPHLPFWKVADESLLEVGNNTLIEIPIATANVDAVRTIFFKMLKLKAYNRIVPKGCIKRELNAIDGSNFKSNKAHSFFSASNPMLNFSDGSSFSELKYIFSSYVHRFDRSKFPILPVVAISHPKTFGEKNSFDKFLRWLHERGDVEFSTYAKVLNELNGNK